VILGDARRELGEIGRRIDEFRRHL